MPLFAVLLLVLGLRDVLIALDLARAGARLVEIELARVLGTDGDVREQPVEVLTLTVRAMGRIAGANQLLELVPAASALVFVDGHEREFNTRLPVAHWIPS